jgi:hypothetical protein
MNPNELIGKKVLTKHGDGTIVGFVGKNATQMIVDLDEGGTLRLEDWKVEI